MPSPLTITYTCNHTSTTIPNYLSTYPPPLTLPHPCRLCHWSLTNNLALALQKAHTPILEPLNDFIADREHLLAFAEHEVRSGRARGSGVVTDLVDREGKRIVGWMRGSRERSWVGEVEEARNQREGEEARRKQGVERVWEEYERFWGPGRR